MVAAITRQIFSSRFSGFDGKRPFAPHVTIFKPQQKNRFKKPDMSFFTKAEEYDFGIEEFDSIQLCSMAKPVQENGYYHVEHEVTVMDAQPALLEDGFKGIHGYSKMLQFLKSEREPTSND